MKIIHIDNIRILMQNRTEYKIQTPLGILDNINDAVELYPYIKTHERIGRCPVCGLYFLKYGKGDNARKYCSIPCSKRANSKNTQKNYYNKLFVNIHPFKTDYYTQQILDNENRQADKQNPLEYHQDDNYWGLGTGNLKEHRAYDFTKEHKYIRNELRKLGLV